MPVVVLRQIPDDQKVELSNIVRQYKQNEQGWQNWALVEHKSQDNLIDSFRLNYLISLFKQRRAKTRNLPETVILSLKDTIEGRRCARDMYHKHGIPDAGRHDHPIIQLEEIYKLATTSQLAPKPRTSNDVKLAAVTNDLGNVSSSLQPDDGSDAKRTIADLPIAIESGTSENNSPEISALPGLLMDEIMKCIDEVEECWNTFFQPPVRPVRPGNLVSTALVTCAADDCIRSLTYIVDLLFTEDEKHEFARLAQFIEEKWGQQWSVKRVYGKENPMAKKKRQKSHQQNKMTLQDHSSPSKETNPPTQAPFELTEALSHKALSAPIFVPMPSDPKHQRTPSKLDNFRKVLTIHLWYLSSFNLADNGAEDFSRQLDIAAKITAMRHAYVRSFLIWDANNAIKETALRRVSPDTLLQRIDRAIQSCHGLLKQYPLLTINPWLLGYLIAVHHGTSEMSFRKFTATNFTSCFGSLALQFAPMQEDQTLYPCLYEFIRSGRIGGSPSLLGALFGQGQYRRADYRPSTNVRTLGVDFLRDIHSAALFKRQPVDWWVEFAANRSIMDEELRDTVEDFAIFETHCRRYEEIFAVPELQFGVPHVQADDAILVNDARSRPYQRQWAQELDGIPEADLDGIPEADLETFFKDHSEESLMELAGIRLTSPLKITEHLLRASNCSVVNGNCMEFVLYVVQVDNYRFPYTLGEPLRVGKDFKSLRTTTYLILEPVRKMSDTNQHIGIIRQSRKFDQDVLTYLRKQEGRAAKEIISVDSTFVHNEQAKSHLRLVSHQEKVAERPSKFLLASGTMKAVLHIMYRKWKLN